MPLRPGGSSDAEEKDAQRGADEDGGYCYAHEQHLLPEGMCGECAIGEQEDRDNTYEED